MDMQKEKIRLLFDGVSPSEMTHLSAVSGYNYNYYIYEGALLYAESDDDNFTEWYWVLGNRKPIPVGASYASDNDKIITAIEL